MEVASSVDALVGNIRLFDETHLVVTASNWTMRSFSRS